MKGGVKTGTSTDIEALRKLEEVVPQETLSHETLTL